MFHPSRTGPHGTEAEVPAFDIRSGLLALLAAWDRCDAVSAESLDVAMNTPEFFTNLLGRDTSRELAMQLVEVYRVRTRDQQTTTAYSAG